MVKSKGDKVTLGFLVAVEVDEGGPTSEQIALKLGDAPRWMEGVGNIDVDQMGAVDPTNDEVDEVEEVTDELTVDSSGSNSPDNHTNQG